MSLLVTYAGRSLELGYHWGFSFTMCDHRQLLHFLIPYEGTRLLTPSQTAEQGLLNRLHARGWLSREAQCIWPMLAAFGCRISLSA